METNTDERVRVEDTQNALPVPKVSLSFALDFFVLKTSKHLRDCYPAVFSRIFFSPRKDCSASSPARLDLSIAILISCLSLFSYSLDSELGVLT